MQCVHCTTHTNVGACYDANAIPTWLRYTGTYAAAITGRYGWDGLGGQGMGCEWLAELVWGGGGGGAGRSGDGLRMVSRVSL